MSGSLNANTDLPMSLKADKLQQIRQTRPEQIQAHLARRLDRKNDEKQLKVNSRDKAENRKIDGEEDRETGNKRRRNSEKEQENRKGKDENCKMSKKGQYIDVKI